MAADQIPALPAPVAWDTAYPGSMSERKDGYFLRRDDHKSLASALVELIASRDREIEDLRAGLDSYKHLCAAAPDLLSALEQAEEAMRWIDHPTVNRAWDKASAAIARAQGATHG